MATLLSSPTSGVLERFRNCPSECLPPYVCVKANISARFVADDFSQIEEHRIKKTMKLHKEEDLYDDEPIDGYTYCDASDVPYSSGIECVDLSYGTCIFSRDVTEDVVSRFVMMKCELNLRRSEGRLYNCIGSGVYATEDQRLSGDMLISSDKFYSNEEILYSVESLAYSLCGTINSVFSGATLNVKNVTKMCSGHMKIMHFSERMRRLIR